VRHRVRRARGWEGRLRGRCDWVEHAATAEECAVCMACCSGAAPDPHAATSRDYGGKLLGSTAQRGAGCGVQCTRSAATGGECERAVCADGAISATIRYAPPQGKAVLVGSAPERADDDAIREERRPSPKSVRYKRAVGRLRISRPREPTCGCSFAANLLDLRSALALTAPFANALERPRRTLRRLSALVRAGSEQHSSRPRGGRVRVSETRLASAPQGTR
jgi:hypothetical protein